MPRSRPIRAALMVALLATVPALAGCSVSTSSGVEAEEVAKEARKALDEVAHKRGAPDFPPITCPEDLEEEVGSTMTCHWTQDGKTHDVKVKVTGNEDNKVNMDFESDALPSH